MKAKIPVTLDDLEATAKDNKHGIALYKYLKVYWDDATNRFAYYYKRNPLVKTVAEAYLKECQK